MPGVRSVGVLHPGPFTSTAMRALQNPDWVSKPNSGATRDRRDYVTCIVGSATTGAFEVVGVRIVAGRAFTESDVSNELGTQEAIQFLSSRPGERKRYSGVAIINEALAQRLWPHENAIGKEFYDRGSAVRTVVGIVSSFQQSGYSLTIMPAAYYPFTGLRGAGSFVVRLRTGTSIERLAADTNEALLDLVPDLARIEVESMQAVTESSLANLRLALILLGCFSFLGTVVAGLGVYAAATLMAAERSREMAIRLALGARRPRSVGLRCCGVRGWLSWHFQ